MIRTYTLFEAADTLKREDKFTYHVFAAIACYPYQDTAAPLLLAAPQDSEDGKYSVGRYLGNWQQELLMVLFPTEIEQITHVDHNGDETTYTKRGPAIAVSDLPTAVRIAELTLRRNKEYLI